MAESFDEKAVFLAALELAPERRDAFLDQACPDAAARARIVSLLVHHAQAADALLAVDAGGLATPEQIDEFKILGVIGEGGMGIVYLAEDTILRRRVAIKVLARHLARSEGAIARFRQEAQHAAALQHPGIVTVFKFGTVEGSHYLVSEYVDGRTLTEVVEEERERRRQGVRTGERAWRERAARLAAQVADALEHAHRGGIVHRDVKPSNILIDQAGAARLTDFGIARQMEDGGVATQQIGSCHYMSPEQATVAGARVDQRSDVFSLGVVLYEALALARPFEGQTVAQVLKAVSTVQPARLRTLDAGMPKDLETITEKAIEKSPVERYQSAGHMAADLRSFLAGDPILARPAGTLRRMRGWMRRRKAPLAVAAGCVLLAVCGGAVWGMMRMERARLFPLAVRSGPEGAILRARRLDVEGARTVEVGRIPAATRLERGHYRLTAVAADGAFAETSVLLVDGLATEMVDLKSARAALDEEMLLVPAGTYEVGSGESARNVRLEGVYVDLAEVSNAEYRAFTQATGYPQPPQWAKFGYDAALADRPVVGVSWEDAQAYARSIGKRLPTADEWECAMRLAGGGIVPWTEAPAELRVATVRERDRLEFGGWEGGYKEYAAHTVGVRSGKELRTRSGMFHGASNVSEMTDTVLGGPSMQIVVKGASWVDDPEAMNFADKVTAPARSGGPVPEPIRSLKTGFRCARSLHP